MEFLKKHWEWFAAAILVLVIVLVIYFLGKKQGSNNVTVKDDTGNIVTASAADQQAAQALAQRLKDDIDGINWLGHDKTIYFDLSKASDVLFALTFAKYRALTGNYLTSDLNGEFFGSVLLSFPVPMISGDWDVLTIILNRANKLSIQ